MPFFSFSTSSPDLFFFFFKILPPRASEVQLSFPLNTRHPSGNILDVLSSHYEDQYLKNDGDLLFMAISIVAKGDRPNNSLLLQTLF